MTKSFSTRFLFKSSIAFFAVLFVGISGGCKSGEGRGIQSDAGPYRFNESDAQTGVDNRDRITDGVIKIDEMALKAAVEQNLLTLRIPLSSASGASSGTLTASLQSVDGKSTASTNSATYSIAKQGEQIVTITLAMPADVQSQPDLVRYNLLIKNEAEEPIQVKKSLFYLVPPYEIRLEGPAKLAAHKKITYRVRAQDPISRQPIQGMRIQLSVTDPGGKKSQYSAETTATGDAVFSITCAQSGSQRIVASVNAQGTSTQVEDTVDVKEPGQKILLTSDKPIYQPGQTIHLRALALAESNNAPVVDEEIVFEIEDGKGNKIFKKALKTSAFGIASTSFKFASLLNTGSCKVRAVAGAYRTEKTVEVYHYALPKFKADVTIEKPWYRPGETVSGKLQALYFFGKPVAKASVEIEALTLDVGENVFQKVVGVTDANGAMAFSVVLPKTLAGLPLEQGRALVTLRATITDTAQQKIQKDTAVIVAPQQMSLALVPESTAIVPGIENRLHLFASDPLGNPVGGADATAVGPNNEQLAAKTDEFGHVEFRFTPLSAASQYSFSVTVVATTGLSVHKKFSFDSQSGSEHVMVRTDKTVYDVGEQVKVSIALSNQSSYVYLDWLNQGQTVDMRTLEATDGKASLTMAVDTTLIGSNRIEAYIVDKAGNIIRAGRTIYVKNGRSLSVDMRADKDVYAPGQPAKLSFTVTDEKGDPAVAALGVQIVDEAVFALIDAQPGLLRTYFELEDAYSKPQYEIEGPQASLSQLLFNDTSSEDPDVALAAQVKTEATLAALGATSVTGIQEASWNGVFQQSISALSPYYADERKRLVEVMAPIVQSAVTLLSTIGCKTNVSQCAALNRSYCQALTDVVNSKMAVSDFWGSAYKVSCDDYVLSIRMSTSGPDELQSNKDDYQFVLTASELGISISGPNAGKGGAAGGMAAAAGGKMGAAANTPNNTAAGAPVDAGSSSEQSGADTTGGSSSEPRVRKDFPETLYYNPAIITDSRGVADIDVGMADSITAWRISSLANAANGKLGSSVGTIRVFQDFFVDIDFPATLTRGDEIEFPIAVYNYLQTAQNVSLELQSGDWFTALGQTSASLELKPNEVVGIRFPVRVDKVGLHTLTVRALGVAASDAVARTVRVVSDGKAFQNAISGALATGQVEHTVDFPANSITGSEVMAVNVYPAFLSQAVDGMDSILQTPSGCFEQTTSTTWPNVLVTNYMKQTNQITTEIQMKAQSLISAGYQRLLTYEHSQGGFSWFGEQDPEPNISVTAFGLMEFADMAKVHPVDEAMIERTSHWMLSQQDGDGSWKGDQTEFFSFNTSTLRNTAFVVWSLASSGYQGSELENGLSYVKNNLNDQTADAYTLGIAANAFAKVAPNDSTTGTLLAQLDQMKKVNGDKAYWDSGDTQTSFYCGGDDAAVATTAIVAHAMLQGGSYRSTANAALQYLTGSKDPNGNFGSTQATIWTLRTLLLAAQTGTEGAVGNLSVSVDGALFTTLALTSDQSDVMTSVDLSTFAELGVHDVTLGFQGTGKVSYNLVSSYNLPWSQVPVEPSGPLSVTIAYDRTTFTVDEFVSASVTVRNNTASTQNMILVTVGIPPGFEVYAQDLDQYKKQGVLSSYEMTGKQLTLYLTEIAPSATQLFKYRIKATMPVKAADGGAEVSLYYEPKKRSKAPSTTLRATIF